ncbi:hypothetical protein HY024_01195 [Candidatus Curtissbacteria bacterium]|nr:hypothetical protein [Candidatus Curtissbacteria bacterium]
MSPPERGLHITDSFADLTASGSRPDFLNPQSWRRSWTPSSMRPIEVALPEGSGITATGLQLFDRVAFGLCNADLKGAVVVHGLSSEPKPIGAILNSLKTVWPLDASLPQRTSLELKYLQEGLCAAGMASETQRGDRSYYALTPDGINYAKPVV